MLDTPKSVILDLTNRFGSETLERFWRSMAASDRIEDLYRLGFGSELEEWFKEEYPAYFEGTTEFESQMKGWEEDQECQHLEWERQAI